MYYLIVGPTCTGKDKIASYMLDNFEGIKIIKSTTSRPIRPSEKNGREYYFVTSEEFKEILDRDGFVEYREYHTTVKGKPDIWYYGVEKEKVSDEGFDYVAVLNYQGAVEFAEYFGRDNCVLIYVKSLYYQRYMRNILRGDFDESEWNRRNHDDAPWLMEAEADADLIIENYGFDHPIDPSTINTSIDIVEAERSLNKSNFQDTQKDIKKMLEHFSKNK